MIEAICNNMAYINKSKGYLLDLYYLVLWKSVIS